MIDMIIEKKQKEKMLPSRATEVAFIQSTKPRLVINKHLEFIKLSFQAKPSLGARGSAEVAKHGKGAKPRTWWCASAPRVQILRLKLAPSAPKFW